MRFKNIAAKTCSLIGMAMFLLANSMAQAGNWSSGGGEILEHSQNPWFVETATTRKAIRVCIMSDDQFPIGLDQLETQVISTMLWWQGQFGNAVYPENKIPIKENELKLFHFDVNPGNYVLESCNKETELTFQFGVLTPEQKIEFAKLNIDIRRYVALSVRTDYSDALRGKGFIYVSPDRGPNAFVGQKVRKDALLKQKRAIKAQCTNFAGRWKGTCVNDNQTESEESELVIEQSGCYELIIDGFTQPINGIFTFSTSGSNSEFGSSESTNVSRALVWNDSQTQLKTMLTAQFGGLITSGDVVSVSGLQTTWLAGDQLRIKDTYSSPVLGIDGPLPYPFVKSDCTYEKQAK